LLQDISTSSINLQSFNILNAKQHSKLTHYCVLTNLKHFGESKTSRFQETSVRLLWEPFTVLFTLRNTRDDKLDMTADRKLNKDRKRLKTVFMYWTLWGHYISTDSSELLDWLNWLINDSLLLSPLKLICLLFVYNCCVICAQHIDIDFRFSQREILRVRAWNLAWYMSNNDILRL